MSITDELREYAQSWRETPNLMDELDAGDIDGLLGDFEHIADRIDAEHEKALDEWKAKHGQMWFKGYAECHAELLEGNETLASDLEGCGWIRLPKDADGEPIHVGDVMEWVRYKDDDPTIVRTVSGIGNDVFFAWSDEQGRYAQYEAHAYRHHHAPTVEDVLRDVVTLCHNTWKEGSAFEFYDVDDVMKSSNISEYAAKLRMAESEDA